jgi:gliding motility-associated-like protein
MKKIFCTLLVLAAGLPAVAQQGKDGAGVVNGAGTIVNSYTTLSADVSAGSTAITVGSVASLSAGDLVMIIQMQGAVTNVQSPFPGIGDPNSAGPYNSTFGEITSYNGAGNNEMAEISSIAANTITFNCALINSYSAAGKTQIVRVPRYTSLAIGASGVITCPHWDRNLGYGGVIALEVHGNTTITSGGRIDATGLGFRGGAIWNKTASTAGAGQWGAIGRNEGGNKGESIAGDTVVYGTFSAKFCKGAIANGGGGGNAVNAGGGGGANAGVVANYTGTGNPDNSQTAYTTCWNLEGAGFATSSSSGGGRGGYTYSNDNDDPRTGGINNGNWGTSDNRRVEGGRGGRPLNYSTGLIFLGGGGGCGDHENGYGGSAGDGGGIVYLLSYGTVSGAGQIISDGAVGSNTNTTLTAPNSVRGREGASGGGGGGAIVISSTGLVSGVAINARGGNGGNNTMQNQMVTASRMAYGPGGGGGGGYIGVPAGTTATSSIAGGNNGIVNYLAGGAGNSCQIDDIFPPNGATRGGAGEVSPSTTSFSIVTTGATICSGQIAVLSASLSGTAPNPVTINWYTTSVGGTPIATGTSYTTTTLSITTTFYVGTCPGTYREPVVVTVTSAPAAPTASSPISYCLNATASQLTATAGGGNSLLWWGTDAVGGTSSATAPTPVTTGAGTVTYYVSQTNGSCEGPRQAIVVNTLNLPNAPTAGTPVDYCLNATASQLTATAGGGNSLLWWGTDATGGTSSAIAPTPSTGTVGTITYYVSESNGTCESARTPIDVNVNALPAPPTVADTISYCQNETATPLTPAGAGINWYTSASGGSPVATPTPNTGTVGTTTYYVSQTQSGCESNRDSIKVVVNTSFLPPAVTNVNYCAGETPVDLSTNATGTGTLNWWGTDAIGGTSSATAPTPSTATAGTVSYYVSQGSATCESNRAQIDVVVTAVPNEPTVPGPNVIYCQNDVATPLTATADPGNTLVWYTSVGGPGSATAPTPSTATAGNTSYLVSQTNGICESAQENITVMVNALPSPPTLADTASYCQNEVATPLQPNSSNINWYTTPAGGTAVPSITPNTSTAGTTTYYASIIVSGCESPRDSIIVSINISFPAPAVTDTSYCQGATANFLTFNASGTTTLNWYTASTGGTGTVAPPTPSTSTPGSTFYYVSQGTAACESGRSEIEVVIHGLPALPVGTDVNYCQNESAVPLNATGTGALNWYTVIGGTASSTAPTPNTSTVGATNYFVSQTDANGCQGGSDTVTVLVINLQNSPTASNVSYCQGATAIALSATGTSALNWWGTSATGGTSGTVAPTPSTGASGTTTYYVSQGTGACESPRTPIVVTVNAPPTLSFVQNASTGCAPACITFTPGIGTATSVQWNFGDGTTATTANVVHCYTIPGIYNVTLTGTSTQGCTNTVTVTSAVTVSSGANAQFTLNPGLTVSTGTDVTFLADTNMTQTYSWNFADASSGVLNSSASSNPSHMFDEEGTYCVQLIATASTCKDTSHICIEVLTEATISIPNIFTPNSDGLNDLFVITSEGLKTMEGSIFDRWGLKLHSWSGIGGGWDGKGKGGKSVSNGVYYYIISTSDFKNEAKQYSGYVQVIGTE